MNSNQSINTSSDSLNKISKKEFIKRIKQILSNKVYVSLVFALTGLYFTVTGIQYWTMNYMKEIFL